MRTVVNGRFFVTETSCAASILQVDRHISVGFPRHSLAQCEQMSILYRIAFHVDRRQRASFYPFYNGHLPTFIIYLCQHRAVEKMLDLTCTLAPYATRQHELARHQQIKYKHLGIFKSTLGATSASTSLALLLVPLHALMAQEKYTRELFYRNIHHVSFRCTVTQ